MTLSNYTQQTYKISSNWQGALWKIFSCACFVASNTTVKYLSGGSPIAMDNPLPIPVITFFQYFFAVFFMLPSLLKSKGQDLKTKYPGLEMCRLLISVTGIILWYCALKYMPLAQVVALSFIGPAITVSGAVWFLNEYLSWQRIVALILAFLGAFFILRPDLKLTGAHHLGLLIFLPLIAAIAFSGSKLFMRKLALLGSTPKQLATYLLIFMAPCALIPALIVWETPSASHWPWLICIGALIACAHLALTKSFALAEVSFLSAFGFVKFFFSVLAGFIFFSELPNTVSEWIGIGIVFSSIYVLSLKKQTSVKTTRESKLLTPL